MPTQCRRAAVVSYNREMTARIPAPEPLIGRFIRLDVMTDEDLPDLWKAIGRPQVFADGYGGGLAALPKDLAGFKKFASRYYSRTRKNVYTVRLVGGDADGTVVGTTTLGDFDLPREAAHIGWTAYDPAVWGTAVNAEAKLLLLNLAFSNGFGRVRIQADALNDHSRAAILKLGAKFEGLLRRDQRRADGTWRTTAIYSVIVDEWPDVRHGLETRLARWTRPVDLRAA